MVQTTSTFNLVGPMQLPSYAVGLPSHLDLLTFASSARTQYNTHPHLTCNFRPRWRMSPGRVAMSTRRRSRSNSTGKRVEFIDLPILSSDEPSQPESSAFSDIYARELAIDTERMGKICEKLKEPDPWPSRFSKTIEQRHEGIVNKLKESRENNAADKAAFEHEFLPLIQKALGGIDGKDEVNPANTAIHVDFLGAERQPYCEGLVNLMKQSDALIRAFDQLSAREAEQSRFGEIITSFKKEKDVAVATVQAGRQVAEADVENLLADRFQNIRSPSGLKAEEQQRGRMLLSRGINLPTATRETVGWGNVARDAEKAMAKLCFAGHKHLKEH
ncbi:hypothetical protein EDD36DRAFT_274547 [Exophiala viscosa]|uniref:Uncharacterized protein n=1 Tax=Exophiala viscosa TaxID=2486360 RepID=A0AAN6IDZ9_9EURO|nr:hypothetical protein EDD36DRAFT_274547 [Exophiala viscosa]